MGKKWVRKGAFETSNHYYESIDCRYYTKKYNPIFLCYYYFNQFKFTKFNNNNNASM